jgi:hypothetical protein
LSAKRQPCSEGIEAFRRRQEETQSGIKYSENDLEVYACQSSNTIPAKAITATITTAACASA